MPVKPYTPPRSTMASLTRRRPSLGTPAKGTWPYEDDAFTVEPFDFGPKTQEPEMPSGILAGKMSDFFLGSAPKTVKPVDALSTRAPWESEAPPLAPIAPVASHTQDPLAILKVEPAVKAKPGLIDKDQTSKPLQDAWDSFKKKYPEPAKAISYVRLGDAKSMDEKQVDGWVLPDRGIEVNPSAAKRGGKDLEALIAHEVVHLLRDDGDAEGRASKIEKAYRATLDSADKEFEDRIKQMRTMKTPSGDRKSGFTLPEQDKDAIASEGFDVLPMTAADFDRAERKGILSRTPEERKPSGRRAPMPPEVDLTDGIAKWEPLPGEEMPKHRIMGVGVPEIPIEEQTFRERLFGGSDLARQNAFIESHQTGAKPMTQRPAPTNQFERTNGLIEDAARAIVKSVALGVPESIVGLASLGSGGHAGKFVEDHILDFEATKARFDQYWPPTKRNEIEQAAFDRANGFVEKAVVALTSPSLLVDTIASSLPLMVAGGVIGRTAAGLVSMPAKLPGLTASATQKFAQFLSRNAGAVGEGSMAAGSSAEGVRQQTKDGLLTAKQTAVLAGSGALTGVIGGVSNKLAKKWGIDDIDSFAAGAMVSAEAKMGLAKRVVYGALQEGLMEELFQGSQEQIASNFALGRPLTEGLSDAVILGTLTGGVMGGSINLARGAGDKINEWASKPPPLSPDEIAAAARAAAGGPPGSPVTPPPPAGMPPAAAGVPPAAAPHEALAGQRATFESLSRLEAELKSTKSPERRAAIEQELTGLRRTYEDAYQAIGNAGGDPVALRKMVEAPPETTTEREYSSTQIDLPAPIAESVLQYGRNIPDVDLAEKGREASPHLTVKYGLHTDDVEEVRKILSTVQPFTVKLGRTSMFPDSESKSGDVVKVNANSPELAALNHQISKALANTDTHPKYQPHVTIAYVKPGRGKAYVNDDVFLGTEIPVTQITFSGKDGRQVSIPLGQAIPVEGPQVPIGEPTPVATPAAPTPAAPVPVPPVAPVAPVAPAAPIPMPPVAPPAPPVAPIAPPAPVVPEAPVAKPAAPIAPPKPAAPVPPVEIGRVAMAGIHPDVQAAMGIGKTYSELNDAELGELLQWSSEAMKQKVRAIAADGDRVNAQVEAEIERRQQPHDYFLGALQSARDARQAAKAPVAPAAPPAPAQAPAAPTEAAAEPEGPIVLGPAPTKKATQFKEIGQNAIGETLYEDEHGVRSYVVNGIRHSEPVRMIPTKTGVQIAVDRTGDRAKEWAVVEAKAEPAAAPAPQEGADPGRLMDTPTKLSEFVSHGGVRYELHKVEGAEQGILRTFDEDSGQTVTIIKYPTFGAAQDAYKKAVEIAAMPAATPKADTAPTPKPTAKAFDEMTPEEKREELARRLKAKMDAREAAAAKPAPEKQEAPSEPATPASASEAPVSTASGYTPKVGDRVRLLARHPVGAAGTEGTITKVDADTGRGADAEPRPSILVDFGNERFPPLKFDLRDFDNKEWAQAIIAPVDAEPATEKDAQPSINWDAAGLGNTPNGQNIDYLGFTTEMSPDQFLALATPVDAQPSTVEFIKAQMSAGEPVAPPMLYAEWDGSQWRVSQHEGRHRAYAAKALKATTIPVQIKPSKKDGELRARHITDEMRSASFVSQRASGASDAPSDAKTPDDGMRSVTETAGDTPTDSHVQRLYADAKARGFMGTEADLERLYNDKRMEARQIANAANESDDDSGMALLQAISDLGGFGIGAEGETGMRGELTKIIEDLNRQDGRIRKGPRTGQRLPKSFRRSGGLPGAPGIIQQVGGYPVDTMREMVSEDPRWAGQFENVSEFLEAVEYAVGVEVGTKTKHGTAKSSVEGALTGVLGVREGTDWWDEGRIHVEPRQAGTKDERHERESIAKLNEDRDTLRDEYVKRFGPVYNADNMSELLGVHEPNRRWARLNAVRAAAAAAVQRFFEMAIDEPVDDDNDIVLFTGGGTGSGKSTGASKGERGYYAVLDTTMANYDASKANIEAVRESGRFAEIRFVSRDPIEAFMRGVLPRAIDPARGRPVPIHTHALTHVNARDAALRLGSEYEAIDDFKVAFSVLENTPDGIVERDLEWLRQDAERYNDVNAIKSEIAAALRLALESGTVPGLTAEIAERLGLPREDQGKREAVQRQDSGRGGRSESAGPVEPDPSAPQPFTAETLKTAFHLTDEQALGLEALAHAIGLDTSKIQVASGGEPGPDALRAEPPARLLFQQDDDVLPTGEKQPRLPGDVGAVRDQEKAQPPVAPVQDVFTLTAPAETEESQGSLFQLPPNARALSRWYYSNISNALATWVQKGTPSQLLAHLAKFKGTKEESQAIGLNEWLQAQTGVVTRQQVEAFVDANQIELETVIHTNEDVAERPEVSHALEILEAHGYEVDDDEFENGISLRHSRSGSYPADEELTPAVLEAWTLVRDTNESVKPLTYKGDAFYIPGGTNQREVLIRMPRFVTPEGRPIRTSHWDETNVIAHVRLQDMLSDDGNVALVVEEIQSDLHQTGKKLGYASPEYDRLLEIERQATKALDAAKPAHATTPSSLQEALPELYQARVNATNDLMAYMREHNPGSLILAPDAPFKGSAWVNLAVKRILTMAAAEGYREVVFLNSDVQTKRNRRSDEAMVPFYDEQAPNLVDAIGKKFNARTWPTKIGQAEVSYEHVWMGPDVSLDRVKQERHARVGLHSESAREKRIALDYVIDRMEIGDTFKAAMEYNVTAGETLSRLFNGSMIAREIESRPGGHSILIPDAMRQALVDWGQPLFQGPQGAVDFIEDGKAIIRGLENPNFSTGVHELIHVARRVLLNRNVPADRRQGVTDEDIKTAEDFAGAVDGVWSVAAEEKLARAFERYLRDGAKGITEKLAALFDKIKTWMAGIYAEVEASPIDVDVTPEMRDVFDRLVTRQQRLDARAAAAAKAEADPKQAQIDQEREANQAKRAAALKKLSEKLRTQANTFDAEMLDLVLEIVGTYVKEGTLVFREAALAFQRDMGDQARALDEAFETAWEMATGEEGNTVEAALAATDTLEERPNAPRSDDGERTAGPRDQGEPSGRDRDGNAPGVEGTQPGDSGRTQGPGDPDAGRDDGAAPRAEGAAEEAGPAGGRDGVVGSGSADSTDVLDASEAAQAHEVEVAAARGSGPHNFVITETADLTEGGWKEKLRDNLDAIDLLLELEKENRPASPQEQAVLARYIGWGHTELAPTVHYNPKTLERRDKTLQEARAHLDSVLSYAEMRSLADSTPNSHYSFSDLPRAMWRMSQRMGFKGGVIVEPAVGTGHFFGTMPSEIMGHPSTRLLGIDKEPIAARIARQLYQSADIHIGPLEQSNTPSNYADLVKSNVPFGDIGISDPAFLGPDRQIMTRSVHNYYFGKALDMVRPGGLVMFVTSRFTMDAKTDAVRQYLHERARLVAAFRLPQEAFQVTAGTSVIADIIILQKRMDGEAPSANEPAWMSIEEKTIGQRGSDTYGWADINEYFTAHPDHVLGTEAMNGKSQYSSNNYNVVGKDKAVGVTQEQWDAAVAAIPEKILSDRIGAVKVFTPKETQDTKEGSFVMKDGAVHVYRDGELVKSDLPQDKLERLKGFITVRDAHSEVLDANIGNASDADLEAAQKRLTKAYEAFVARFGILNSRANASLFQYDPNGPRVLALEFVTKTKPAGASRFSYIRNGLARIFNTRVSAPLVEPTTAGTPIDALAISLAWRGQVEMPFLESLTGQTEAEIVAALEGKVYLDPETHLWVHASHYLSGDVVTKLAQARAKGAGYEANVAALEAVQPRPLAPEEFDVPFGASYVPLDLYRQFVYETLRADSIQFRLFNSNQSKHFAVDLTGGRHEFLPVFKHGYTQVSTEKWVTDTINNKLPTIWFGRGKDRVKAGEETERYRESLKQLRELWDSWWVSNPEASRRLAKIHNELFNRDVAEVFDGSHLVFPNIAADIELRSWQKNAVWRVITSGNTGIFHAVGTGKTYIGAGIAGEWKRLGRANKIVITVPNPVVDQWRTAYLTLYPHARILVPTKDDFQAKNRRQFISSIANNDWDVILMGHTQYTRVSVSIQALRDFVEEQVQLLLADGAQQLDVEIETFKESIEELDDPKTAARNLGRFGWPDGVKDIAKAIQRLKKRLADRLSQAAKDAPVTFEQLGVDALIVDEAHAFKSLYFTTSMGSVAGVKPSPSDRALDMFLKTRILNKASNNRNLVFLTGTPITNAMSEVYTAFRYLAQGALERLGMGSFDSWATAYTTASAQMEPGPTGGYVEKTRLRHWRNLRELSKLFRRFGDILTSAEVKLLKHPNGDPVIKIPELKNGRATVITTAPHAKFGEFMERLKRRIDGIKSGNPGNGGKDNMLWVTSDAGKAAIDLRLLDPELEEDPNGRIPTVAREVASRYKASAGTLGTQLLFLDIGVPDPKTLEPLPDHVLNAADESLDDEDYDDDPMDEEDLDEGDEFLAATATFSNLYNDLRDKMIERGVKRDEIAFIHQARNPEEMKKLFAAVRAGRIRVLIATRAKGGIGVNVQHKVVAIHHIDVPWRPDQLEQANGRGFRQLNENLEVEDIRYVTERSFDAFRWGLLALKNDQIIRFYRGELSSFDDIDTSQIDIEHTGAAATGDPRALEMLNLEQQVRGLRSRELGFALGQRKAREERQELGLRFDAIHRGIAPLEDAKKALEEWLNPPAPPAAAPAVEGEIAVPAEPTHGPMISFTYEPHDSAGYATIRPMSGNSSASMDWGTKEGREAIQTYLETLFARHPRLYGDVKIGTAGPFNITAASVSTTQSKEGVASTVHGIQISISVPNTRWSKTLPTWFENDDEAPDFKRSLSQHLTVQKLDTAIDTETAMLDRLAATLDQLNTILSKSFPQAEELEAKAWRLHLLRVELGLSKLSEEETLAWEIYKLEQALESGSMEYDEYQKAHHAAWGRAATTKSREAVDAAIDKYRRALSSKAEPEDESDVAESYSASRPRSGRSSRASASSSPSGPGSDAYRFRPLTLEPGERAGDPHSERGDPFKPAETGILEGPAQPTDYVPTVTLPFEVPELLEIAGVLHKMGARAVKGFRKAGKRGEFSPVTGIKLHMGLFKRGRELELAATLAHEIGHLDDWLPDHLLSRGNLIGRVKSLKKFLKGKFTNPDGTVIHNKTLVDELKAVSARWRPWDRKLSDESFRRYRDSAVELYADAVSMLLNDPGLLQRMAPTFYREFFMEIERKPEVARAYFAIHELVSQDHNELLDRRQRRIEGASRLGSTQMVELIKARIAMSQLSLNDMWQRFRSLILNKHSPFNRMMRKLEKAGIKIPEHLDPRYLLSERSYIGGRTKAFVAKVFQPIYNQVTESGVTWEQFGSLLGFNRIMNGDRMDIANFEGIQPKQAREQYDRLMSRLTESQREVVLSAMDNLLISTKSIMREAYAAGLLSDDMWEKIESNKAYVTFLPLIHIDKTVTAHIFKQKGHLGDIANPADATMLKTLATIRAIAQNRTKVGAIEFLKNNFPADVEQAPERWDANKHQKAPIEPAHDGSGRRLVTYSEQGRLRGVWVDPYIASSLENESLGGDLVRAIGLQKANNFFRPLFTSANLGFQMANVWRDFWRFWKNIPDMTFGLAWNLYTSQEVRNIAGIRAFGLVDKDSSKLRKGIRYLKGKPISAPTTEELKARDMLLTLEQNQVLSVTFNEMIFSDKRVVADTMAEELLTQYDAMPHKIKPHMQGVKQLMWTFDRIVELGDFIETLPKAAGAIHYARANAAAATGNKKNKSLNVGSLTPKQRDFIRTSIGSPDYHAGGVYKAVPNNVFLFSNAIFQGWAADMKIATNPTTASGYWWKTFQLNVVPKLIMIFMPMVAGVMAKAMGGDDDDDDWGRFYDKISEYDKTNYIIVPLGYDDRGRARYLRLPQDDAGRVFGGLLWKAKGAVMGDRGFLEFLSVLTDYAGGQLPSETPYASVVPDFLQMVSGGLVYDPFRGNFLFSREERLAANENPGPAWQKFLKWEAQKLGAGVFWRVNPMDLPAGAENAMDTLLKQPVVSSTISRFFKVSDQGTREGFRDVKEKVESVAAAERQARNRVTDKAIRDLLRAPADERKPVNDMARDLVLELYPDAPEAERRVHFRKLRSQITLGLVRKTPDGSLFDALSSGSNDAKVAVLMRASEGVSKDAFIDWIREAVPSGLISQNVAAESIRRLNEKGGK